MAEQLNAVMEAARARNEAAAAKLAQAKPNVYQSAGATPDYASNVGKNPTMTNTPNMQNISAPIAESNAGYMTLGGTKSVNNTYQNPYANAPNLDSNGMVKSDMNYANDNVPGAMTFAPTYNGGKLVGHDDRGNGLYQGALLDNGQYDIVNGGQGQWNTMASGNQQTYTNPNPTGYSSYQAPQRSYTTPGDVMSGKVNQLGGVANTGGGVATAHINDLNAQMKAAFDSGNYAEGNRLNQEIQNITSGSGAIGAQYQQEQDAANKQAQAVNSQTANQEAATYGKSNNANTPGIPSTGVAQYDNQIAMGAQNLADTQQYALDTKKAQDAALKQKEINALMGTNISDLGYSAADLGKMSLAQLQDLSNTPGLGISAKIKEQLVANDQIRIKNEQMAKENELADNKMVQAQLERNLGRAVTEREQFNAQQDVKMRTSLAAFGGGHGETLSGNMAVMDAEEKGVQALTDLRMDYADRMDSNGRQYTMISQTHTNNINMIQNDMGAKIENAYSALQSKLEGYLDQGVTNQKELSTVMMGAKKEFMNTYVQATNDAAKWTRDANQQTFENLMTLQKDQREQDATMSSAYGYIYKNGQPVLDQQGQRVPTLDLMKFSNQVDQQMTQNTGQVYQDGRLMLDSKGQPIATFDARKFAQQEARQTNEFNQTFGLNVAKFNQDAKQFGMNYALDQQKANLDVAKFQQDAKQFGMNYALEQQKYGLSVDKQVADLLEKGITTGTIDPQTGMIRGSTGIFSANGSKYTPFVDGGEIRVQVPIDQAGTLKAWNSLREQCGEFVNDIMGKKVMGDTIQDKMKKVTSNIATIGSAFVQATNNQYGHTGFVEGVKYNENGIPTSMNIIDSNYVSAGKVARAKVDISYDGNGNPTYTRNGKKIKIEGFTDSILGKTSPNPTQKMTMSPSGNVLMKDANISNSGATITDPQDRVNLELKLSKDLDAYTHDSRTTLQKKSVLDASYNTAMANIDKGESVNAASQALVVSYNKILDPTSVVREGEYARSAEGQSLLSAMDGKIAQMQSGGAGLTRDSLMEFKQAADQFMQGYTENIKDAAMRTQKIATDYKLDLSHILTPATQSILNSGGAESQLQPGEIMVRDKQGNPWAIMPEEFDPNIYTR